METMKRESLIIHLPASKSISNRVLIINAMADGMLMPENLADCDDTHIMNEVLNSSDNCFDVGHAGTAMRFLTAFLSRIVGHWTLTGSSRMLQRPIGPLVDALNQLGARIEYLGKSGFPPLRIVGSILMGGEITISASVSSQYISALMMVAPYMVNGLMIHLNGKVVSRAYIEMTMRVMRDFGARVDWEADGIRVFPGDYIPPDVYRIEADWTAASYFYGLYAVSEKTQPFLLSGLTGNSIQGDAQQVSLWEKLGIVSSFVQEGALLSKQPMQVKTLEYDFTSMPDLVQTFAVACCLLNIPFTFWGVETLVIKETDRLTALVVELARLGFKVEVSSDDTCLYWKGERCPVEDSFSIRTYGDHRMAMAFALAKSRFPTLEIQNKEVVSKSFPGFWEEFSRYCSCFL